MGNCLSWNLSDRWLLYINESSKIVSGEIDLHHNLLGGIPKEFQESVNIVYNFIEIHKNPYKIKGKVKLYHFISDTII